eukprot:1161844-Pelagomonas_calceolata.AAC.2
MMLWPTRMYSPVNVMMAKSTPFLSGQKERQAVPFLGKGALRMFELNIVSPPPCNLLSSRQFNSVSNHKMLAGHHRHCGWGQNLKGIISGKLACRSCSPAVHAAQGAAVHGREGAIRLVAAPTQHTVSVLHLARSLAPRQLFWQGASRRLWSVLNSTMATAEDEKQMSSLSLEV